MYYNLLSTVYAVDTLEPIVKWLTISLLIAITLTSVILFFINKLYCFVIQSYCYVTLH